MKLFFYLLAILCLSSCSHSNSNDLEGSWVFDWSTARNGPNSAASNYRDNCGFIFSKDTCFLPCGFRSFLGNKNCREFDLGYHTEFTIKRDTLKIWDKVERIWLAYFIHHLDKEKLVIQLIGEDKPIIQYKRPINHPNQFDELLVLKNYFPLDSNAICDEEIFYVNKKGVYFNIRGDIESKIQGINSSDFKKVDELIINKVFNNFDYLDLNSSKQLYVQHGRNYFEKVFYFFKNNTLVKSILIENESGPDELIWGNQTLKNNIKYTELKDSMNISTVKEKIKILYNTEPDNFEISRLANE